MAQLPKFRYITDVQKFVKTLEQEVRQLGQLVKVQQQVLSGLKAPKSSTVEALNKIGAAFDEFIIQAPGAGERKVTKNALKKRIDPTLDRVVVPNLKKLSSQYALAEDLYSKYNTLEAVEAQLGMQFADSRDLEKAQAGVTSLKNEIKAQLKEVLGFLNSVAKAHVPASFTKYIKAVSDTVSNHVLFKDSHVFLYVTISPAGSLVFTAYIMLEQALNEDGELAPALYIAIQWCQGQGGKNVEAPYVKVHLDHEYVLPNKLMSQPGTEVDSAGSAVRAISDLLEIENFSSSLGVVPLSFQMKVAPSDINKNMFSFREYISKVAVNEQNNTLRFTMRRVAGVNKESVAKFAQQLYLEVAQLLKKSSTRKPRMKIIRQGGDYFIDFIVTQVAQDQVMTIHDLEFLRDKFKLNDQQIRKIAQIFTAD